MKQPGPPRTHEELRQRFLEEGYTPIGISTRTGAAILRHGELGRVVKITVGGKDPALTFAKWIQSLDNDAFPRIFEIVEGERTHAEVEWYPCAIVMEELQPLATGERAAYQEWIPRYLAWREQQSQRPDDPFGLLEALEALFEKSEEYGGAMIVDVSRPKNVMVRTAGKERRLVVLDPWS